MRLTPRHLDEKPRQLSGGLKQRVGIARAFAGGPSIVVCDEPTSALDVSVQSAILNLLVDLQAQQKVSYLFISHDLNVVHYLSDRIAVLYLGRLMEIGPSDAVFSGPHHPYTEALLSANPSLEEQGTERIRLRGELPSASNLPSGMRVPYALPAQDRRHLRARGAATRTGGRAARDSMPHSRRRARLRPRPESSQRA